VRGTHDRKVGRVSRYYLYIRLTMLLAIFATLALVLGDEPWGPW